MLSGKYLSKNLNSRSSIREYWFELILGGLLVILLIYSLLSSSHYFSRGFSYNSLLHYGACFVIASFFLKRQKVNFVDRMFYSLATMASGIVLYEIVYHYGFGVSFSMLAHDASYFVLAAGNGYFCLDWFLIIFLIPFAWRKYMNLNNKLLWILISFEAIVMLLWVGIGYPQYPFPSWWPAYEPLFNVIPLVNGTGNTASIIFYGGVFSALAKTISVIPAFFFNKRG